jgi:hypothetical protein
MLAPPNPLTEEVAAPARNKSPTQLTPTERWTRGLQEIDVVNWQAAVSDMISVSDLEIDPAATDGRSRSAI